MTYDIFINGAIGWPISYDYVRSELKKCGDSPASVYISSLGGSLEHALKIRQLFVDHGKVTAYIHGFTASAATIIATGAQRVLIGRHALYLAHRCSNWVDTWGQMNAEELGRAIKELQDGQRDLQKVDRTLASIYASRSVRTVQEFSDIMTKAEWLNADEVLALGLADGLVEDEQTASNGSAPATQNGASAAFAAQFAACGLPVPPARTKNDNEPTHTAMATTTTNPTNTTTPAASAPAASAPAASATQENAQKSSGFFAFLDRIVAKLDAYFGEPAASTDGAPAEHTAHTAAAPSAAAPSAAAPAAAAPTPAAPTAAASTEHTEPTEAEQARAVIASLEQRVAALTERIDTMQKQDGDTSDNLAAAPVDEADAERSRPARLRAASQRYRYL